ncbi:MAG TPA: DUF3617 family protein [Candidatus Limnocylindrales bacterium]|nr:DUF3617 family protein [Candidatus Limnocylindrales bacterium]
MMWRWRWLVALMLMMAPCAAAAAGVAGMPVEPGLWEFSSSIPDPTGGTAWQQRHRTCVRERVVTPERVMRQLDECRIGSVVIRGSSASWKMRCQTPAGPMAGTGSLRSTTSSVSGVLELAMTFGMLEIPVTGTFKGRRVGKCQ